MSDPARPLPDPEQPVDAAQVASDLRTTSDHLLRQLDRLQALEARKRELAPDDPEFVRIAREVRDMAMAALIGTQRQERLADEVAALAKSGNRVADHAIEDIAPGPREATLILAEWRAAERRLAAAPEGSDDARAARTDVERLRAEYARTINLRGDEGLGAL